jgi:hypothetical protein
MADFYRDVVARLRAAGYEFKRSGRGDHSIWWHPETKVRLTVDRKLRSKITANEILKDAGLPKAFYSVSRLPDLPQDVRRVLAEPRRRLRGRHRLAVEHDRRAHAGDRAGGG